MTPTRILIGQIVIVLATVAAGLALATQYAAHALGYASGLGASWLTVGGTPIYKPWRIFEWWCVYEAYAPAVFNRARMIGRRGRDRRRRAGDPGLGAARAGAPRRHHYGPARWATGTEIARAD